VLSGPSSGISILEEEARDAVDARSVVLEALLDTVAELRADLEEVLAGIIERYFIDFLISPGRWVEGRLPVYKFELQVECSVRRDWRWGLRQTSRATAKEIVENKAH